MKFDLENVITAVEMDNVKRSNKRIMRIATVVLWTSALALFFLLWPLSKVFSEQIMLLIQGMFGDSMAGWIQSIYQALLVIATCVTFFAAGITLVRWPFAEAIALSRQLQPISDYEAQRLIAITEANPVLDEYRRAVARVREFVMGDYEFICEQHERIIKAADESKRETQRQQLFNRLHSVE